MILVWSLDLNASLLHIRWNFKSPTLGTMQSGGGVGEAAAAALECEQRLRQLGYCARRIAALQHDDIGGMADGDPVIGRIHQPRRQARDHVETRAQIALTADLRNVGVEVRHADERAIAEWRKRVEYVVGGERTAHARSEQPM